jgi:hypothetical protein
MSGNIYEFQPEITRSHIEAGVRRARELRSRYFSNAFSGAFGKGVREIPAGSGGATRPGVFRTCRIIC